MLNAVCISPKTPCGGWPVVGLLRRVATAAPAGRELAERPPAEQQHTALESASRHAAGQNPSGQELVEQGPGEQERAKQEPASQHCARPEPEGQEPGGQEVGPGGADRAALASPALRVLIVDDEPVGRLALQAILQRLGHQARSAENGLQALDALLAAHYDCVFMDIQMPGMNGVAATKALRSDPAFLGCSGVHVIAMTAYAMEGDRELFLADGMNDFVAKPATVADICEALERYRAKR